LLVDHNPNRQQQHQADERRAFPAIAVHSQNKAGDLKDRGGGLVENRVGIINHHPFGSRLPRTVRRVRFQSIPFRDWVSTQSFLSRLLINVD